MIAAAAVALAVAPGTYHGATPEHRRVALTVRAGRVAAVAATFERYTCQRFGDVGPLHVRVATAANIRADGRVTAAAGPPAERLVLHARFRPGGRVTGTLRVRGTIATGAPCNTPALRFAARL